MSPTISQPHAPIATPMKSPHYPLQHWLQWLHYLCRLQLNLLGLACICVNAGAAPINHYHAVSIPFYQDGQETLFIAIRAYENETQQTQFLAVNSETLATSLVNARDVKARRLEAGAAGYITLQKMNATPYMQAVHTEAEPPYPLLNDGLSHARTKMSGAFMTVDLCPSVRPFEQEFFQSLAAQSTLTGRPVPVTINITGLWLLSHPTEFTWLVTQRKLGRLDITWANHSFSHLYFPDVALENNFLLYPSTNLDNEIFDLEQLLLERGELPSIFFRYPGLVSDQHLITRVTELGLIPVGSDAWLAREEMPTQGSIVLVHGNGNEPQGIARALPLIGEFTWLPLNIALIPAAVSDAR